MNFAKSSKQRPQFEILEAKQLLAANVLTSVAGGSETANPTAIYAEEPLSTGAPVRSGLNRLEHGPGLHDSIHCPLDIAGGTMSTNRSGLNNQNWDIAIEKWDEPEKYCIAGGRVSTDRSGLNRLEHGPGLHDSVVLENQNFIAKDNPDDVIKVSIPTLTQKFSEMYTGSSRSYENVFGPVSFDNSIEVWINKGTLPKASAYGLDPGPITMRLTSGRAGSNPTPHPMPVPELVDPCHKDGLDPGSITMRLADGRAGSNRLEHGPGLHD